MRALYLRIAAGTIGLTGLLVAFALPRVCTLRSADGLFCYRWGAPILLRIAIIGLAFVGGALLLATSYPRQRG